MVDYLVHSVTYPYPEADQPSPCLLPILSLEDPFEYYPICATVFQMVSFIKVPPESCIHLFIPPIHATCPAHLIILDLIN